MKTFKVGAIIQIIYFLICLIVIICMPIYGVFHDTSLGDIIFRIGDIFFLVATFIPIGLVGTAINIWGSGALDLKKSKKALVWMIASPIILFMSWYLALGSFIYYTGGV